MAQSSGQARASPVPASIAIVWSSNRVRARSKPRARLPCTRNSRARPAKSRMDSARTGDSDGGSGGRSSNQAVIKGTLPPNTEVSEPVRFPADRARRRGGLCVQRRGNDRAGTVPRLVPHERLGGSVFRACGGHRRAGAPGTSAGTARPQSHRRRNPQSAGPGAKNGAQDTGGRHGAGRSPRACGRQ